MSIQVSSIYNLRSEHIACPDHPSTPSTWKNVHRQDKNKSRKNNIIVKPLHFSHRNKNVVRTNYLGGGIRTRNIRVPAFLHWQKNVDVLTELPNILINVYNTWRTSPYKVIQAYYDGKILNRKYDKITIITILYSFTYLLFIYIYTFIECQHFGEYTEIRNTAFESSYTPEIR